MVQKEYNPVFYQDEYLKNKSGIYQIRNLINGKIYIGSAKNLSKRKNVHFYRLKNNNHHSSKLQNAFNKYGEQNFIFEVIEFVEDKNKLIECEQYWIDKFDVSKFGYNINSCAENRLGAILSDETKLKISESHKGIHSGEKNPMFGKHHTEESRMKMSKNRKPITEEQRKKLSELASKKIGELNPFFGKKHTEETKQKIRESKIGILSPARKDVIRLNDNKIYISLKECAEDNNISNRTVYAHCKNLLKTVPREYMYLEEYNNINNIEKEIVIYE